MYERGAGIPRILRGERGGGERGLIPGATAGGCGTGGMPVKLAAETGRGSGCRLSHLYTHTGNHGIGPTPDPPNKRRRNVGQASLTLRRRLLPICRADCYMAGT